MSPVKGQKVKDDPIEKLVHFRANQEIQRKLNDVSQETGLSKSEVIRRGIEIQYDNLENK